MALRTLALCILAIFLLPTAQASTAGPLEDVVDCHHGHVEVDVAGQYLKAGWHCDEDTHTCAWGPKPGDPAGFIIIWRCEPEAL